jgi:hypothetical protein
MKHTSRKQLYNKQVSQLIFFNLSVLFIVRAKCEQHVQYYELLIKKTAALRNRYFYKIFIKVMARIV